MKRALLAVLVAGSAVAADAPPRRFYELVTETGMPHLEWNLRHAVVTETRCLSEAELATAFWMMGDVSLQDCTLVPQDREMLSLQCTGGHGTRGQARWQWDDTPIRGTLDVRLGGKNMTFWQRIAARPLGACD
jgi:hypothetical protein